MSNSKSVTNLPKPTWIARYDDMNYPGNRFDIQDNPVYYEINFSGVQRQHAKYLQLKNALLKGIQHILETEPAHSALSSAALDLRTWATSRGFSCPHMPYKVLIEHDQYRMFVYALRVTDSSLGMEGYRRLRRYGRWV